MANIEKFDMIADKYESKLRIELFELFRDELLKLGVSGRLLDFGCGTGNLGISLASECETVCLLDPASEMRAVVCDKIDQRRLDNCYVSDLNLESGERLSASFDYIIVAQVLLHIPDYQSLLASLVSSLNQGGTLVIFDYLKNERVSSEIVHNGFDINELVDYLQQLGLSDPQVKVIYKDDKLLLGGYGQLFMLTIKNN